MSDLFKLEQELLYALKKCKQTFKNYHKLTRDDVYALYSNWASSTEGRQWKLKQIKQCGNRCPECNKVINENNSTIDHKHPRAKYPWLAWNISNLWVLCKQCNKNKSDKKWEEYVNAVKIYRGKSAFNRVKKHTPNC